jgi:hypothetical protein
MRWLLQHPHQLLLLTNLGGGGVSPQGGSFHIFIFTKHPSRTCLYSSLNLYIYSPTCCCSHFLILLCVLIRACFSFSFTSAFLPLLFSSLCLNTLSLLLRKPTLRHLRLKPHSLSNNALLYFHLVFLAHSPICLSFILFHLLLLSCNFLLLIQPAYLLHA